MARPGDALPLRPGSTRVVDGRVAPGDARPDRVLAPPRGITAPGERPEPDRAPFAFLDADGGEVPRTDPRPVPTSPPSADDGRDEGIRPRVTRIPPERVTEPSDGRSPRTPPRTTSIPGSDDRRADDEPLEPARG